MNTINEVIIELLGSYKASFYITYFIFVALGILISLRVKAMGRDKLSEETPMKFSWKFLIQDNLMRLLGSLAFVFIFIRVGEDVWGVVPTYGGATIMGLAFDQALLRIKKFESKARKIAMKK